MKIKFDESSPRKVMSAIKKNIEGRKIADMLEFELSDSAMTIQVSQMGTSSLEFSFKAKDGGLLFELSKEKIAFTHKPFMGEMREKLVKIIKDSGGVVLEA
jgi:hypothetical protein